MGVTGLWRLIEPAGKPVPVETLENKVLAVDISIWLHQMVKGYQDAKGAPLPNAHLMGLFQRLCKLLYFRIKPVFVFDGGFPDLKKETIAKRQDNKAKYNSESERIKRELTLLLSKKTAISTLLGKQISPKKGSGSTNVNNDDDIFKLPAMPQKEVESESESEDEHDSSGSIVDLHSVDIESAKFKNLPTREKYDLLIELNETRKMNSWGKLHELPKKSDKFSNFQMQRLLKRRKVQECLQDIEKEVGDSGMSINELELLLNEEGIDTKIETLPTRRIASNNTTRFLLINNVKQALADAKKRQDIAKKLQTDEPEEDMFKTDDIKESGKDELEEDIQKAIKMSLECVSEVDTSACTSKTNDSWTSVTTDSLTDYSDSDDDCFVPPDMSSAKAYIMQYTDFTHKVIDEIIEPKNESDKHKVRQMPTATQTLEDLNNEKSITVDEIKVSSDDENPDKDVNVKDGHAENENDNTAKINVSESLASSESDQNMDQSVISMENAVQGIITLNTNTAENVNNTNENYSKPNSYTEPENDEFDEDLQKAITLSLECMKKTEHEEMKAASESSLESDDDFEEVPEVSNKPSKSVVELTLNMGNVPDDDIFAEIFTNNKDEHSSSYNQVDATTQSPHTKRNIIENTQVEEEHKNTKEFSISNKQRDNINQTPTNPTDSENTFKIPELIKAHCNENRTDNEEMRKSSEEVISTEKLNTIAKEIQTEELDLLQEKGRLDRIGRSITEQMTKEVQELLQIFGIPYIVAPMEAEAQCAFLESVNLTDGTITDDSDIWLFGGKTVYKNFFNQKKHVLQFLAERIEKTYNLTREQFILLALLVGSDYTAGVAGVGPVTAMEILASFPFSRKLFLNETSNQTRYARIVAGLQEFKQWVKTGKRTDNISLRKKLRNISLADDFPSIRVVQSYLEPNVEKSNDKFTWGKIDVTVLRDYTKAKFGWSQNKLDEIIKPVLKRMLDRKNQKSLQDYFKTKSKIELSSLQDQMSSRVKAAVQRLGPNAIQEETNLQKKKVNKHKANEEENNDEETKAGPSKAKRKRISPQTDNFSDHAVKIVTQDGKSHIEINIPKSDRFQEIIPQREKDKQSLLQNKLKAIEIFRKTTIDKKRKPKKKRVNLPKEKAELSESSDSD